METSEKKLYLSCWDESTEQYVRVDGTMDDCVKRIKETKSFVSASIQLSLEMDEVKRVAPADSYPLRRYNFNAINQIKEKLGWSAVDVSFDVYNSKKYGKMVRCLKYTASKNEPSKSEPNRVDAKIK